MLKNIGDIFETFGLGKLEILKLNYKNKTGIIRIHNSTLPQIVDGKNDVQITPAILSGTFSFLLDRDVDAKQTNAGSRGVSYCEYLIR